MTYATYFRGFVFLPFCFALILITSCNEAEEEAAPPVLLEESPNNSDTEGETFSLRSDSNDSLFGEWIIGGWTDNFTPGPVFYFDATHIRYPDSEESYPYRLDSIQIGLYFEEDDFWLYGEVDMPDDSTLVLIFEEEMAVFYKQSQP